MAGETRPSRRIAMRSIQKATGMGGGRNLVGCSCSRPVVKPETFRLKTAAGIYSHACLFNNPC
jgi:hypothetical protein